MNPSRRPREADRLRDPETGEWDLVEVRHRSKGWIAVIVSLAVLLGGLWFVGGRAWDAWMGFRGQDDYIGEGVADVDVEIPKGSTMTQIGRILAEQDVVKSADTFRRYAQSRPDESSRVQAGVYQMRTQIPSSAAFERLLDPANLSRNVFQLREGLRLTEQVAEMAEATGLPKEDFDALVANPAPLGLPDWAKGRPEGFLFPDTYELPARPTAESVMKMTVDTFKRRADEIDFGGRAAASPAKDPYTALVMASLLEREAMSQEDRVKVARVFYNRLEKRMPLQSDATVAYAANISGRVFTTAEERRTDSPYNTYLDKNAGKLPPGPISSPSQDAMAAAVAPADGDWLYFVTVNLDTGETAFNSTLEAHNASVAKLQAWCRNEDPQNKC